MIGVYTFFISFKGKKLLCQHHVKKEKEKSLKCKYLVLEYSSFRVRIKVGVWFKVLET